MHSFSRSLLGLGALTLAGCGAPAELDESRFPGVNETGYTDGLGPVGRAGGGATPPSNAGAFGTSGAGPVTPIGGGGNVGQGGSTAVATAGSGAVSTGGSAPVAQGGQQQGGSAQGGGASTGGDPTAGGSCPDDITELFARPSSQGGCDGPGCHVAGGQKPDLTSPGVETRLLDVVSNCNGLPYISAGESYLENKLVGPPACGFAMPLGGSMSDDDKQCVLDWIAEVSGG